MYWKDHELICNLLYRKNFVIRQTQFSETDRQSKYKRCREYSGLVLDWTREEPNRWHSLYVYTILPSTVPAKHRPNLRPVGTKIHFPVNIFISIYTWSDEINLPDIDQFVSPEAFIKGQILLHNDRTGISPW